MMKKTSLFNLTLFLTITLVSLTEATNGKTKPYRQSTTNDSMTYLDIPARPDDAVEGSEFAEQITGLSLKNREIAIVEEILGGNVPSFSRQLRPITFNQSIDSDHYEVTFYTVCDYMAIGSEQDYLYIPMTPSTAQYLADRLNGSLPTKKLVDIIYAQSDIKLDPQPIPPSDAMTTVPVFKQHTDSIVQQFAQRGHERRGDRIIAGHKKDIIISNKIYSADRNYERVVIYGWHRSKNDPIQPVYNGHTAEYADYSHGVRIISNIVTVNDDTTTVPSLLQDARLCDLLSSEGPISRPYYPESPFLTSLWNPSDNVPGHVKLYQNYPNPFNPTTTIRYVLHRPAFVQLTVYDMLGRKVAVLVNTRQQTGNHTVAFNGNRLAGGVYGYQISAGPFTQSRKMLLTR